MKPIKISSIQFFITQFIVILFWGVPEPLQKIPKILFLCFLVYLYFILLSKKQVSRSQLVNNILILIGCIVISLNGSFQTSLINVLLSSFAIVLLPSIWRAYTQTELKIAKQIASLVCILMLLQLFFFRTIDGRPTLAYEINWSAAYLFIFFIYSDIIKFRFGKFFVMAISLLLLSRLLVFAVVLFYLIKFLKNNRLVPRIKINWLIVLIASHIIFFSFGTWFLSNVKIETSYDSSMNRLTSVNDGSNMLRFRINQLVLNNLTNDSNLTFGYGEVSDGSNLLYTKKYYLMPHNELLDAIVEFGWILTLYFILFSYSFVNRLFRYENYEYIFPTLLFTLILWARFLIVPSLEMFFLFFLFGYNLKKHEITIASSKRYSL